MLELLLQQQQQQLLPGSAALVAAFAAEAAPVPASATVAAELFSGGDRGGGGGGWPAGLSCGAEFEAALDDAEFDAFFGTLETLQLPIVEPEVALVEASADAVVDSIDDQLLQELLGNAGEASMPLEFDEDGVSDAPGGVAVDEYAEEDSALSSSPPMSFSTTTTIQSPNSPTPSSMSSASSYSASTKKQKQTAKPKPDFDGGIGRVQKKKEANREAAYRYRLKQRLGDTIVDQQRVELQSSVDALASRVDAAESEAGFLVSMCSQIFSSRRQLLLRQQQQQQLSSR